MDSTFLHTFFNNNDLPNIYDNYLINNNHVIKNIYNIILKCINGKKYKIKKEKTYDIKKLYDDDSFSLIYILFSCLYRLNLLKTIIYDSSIPDITNYNIFKKWFRLNSYKINYDNIHELINNINIFDSDSNENSDIYEELNTIYEIIFNPIDERAELHKYLYGNSFISLDIQGFIESVNLKCINYTIQDKHKVSLFIPQIDNYEIPDISNISLIIQIMNNISQFYYNDKNYNNPVDLKVFFTNKKKYIQQKMNIICCDSINSGSTIPNKIIVCWRAEEFYKVLIHELVHYHNFDFFSNDKYYNKLEKILLNVIPHVKGKDMLNESYTECFTVIILTILRYHQKKIHTEFDNFFF
jgi:hypothetical protein